MRPRAPTGPKPSRTTPPRRVGGTPRPPAPPPRPPRPPPSGRIGETWRPAAQPLRQRRAGRIATRLSLLVMVPILVGILGGPAATVGADELSDARARQNALAQQIKNQKADIAKINA